MSRATVVAAGGGRSVYAGDTFELLFEGNFAPPQCTMLQRRLCELVGGFDPAMRVAQDTEYFHRVAAVSPVAIIMEPLVKWRVGLAYPQTSPPHPAPPVPDGLIHVDPAVPLRRPPTKPAD